eukprot:3099969-Amphidinium_carterae.1
MAKSLACGTSQVCLQTQGQTQRTSCHCFYSPNSRNEGHKRGWWQELHTSSSERECNKTIAVRILSSVGTEKAISPQGATCWCSLVLPSQCMLARMLLVLTEPYSWGAIFFPCCAVRARIASSWPRMSRAPCAFLQSLGQ